MSMSQVSLERGRLEDISRICFGLTIKEKDLSYEADLYLEKNNVWVTRVWTSLKVL